jgi:hypothetical protein
MQHSRAPDPGNLYRLLPRWNWEMCSQRYAPASSLARYKKKNWYPLKRRLGGPQSRSGSFRRKECLLPQSGIELRTVAVPAPH